mmetsp:Transcript_113786/g.322234  ORF Transcript_113786/g.322234 Transcript_113786/m.322234 type:complete len:232 (-) Transcript_113786:513-1208(-)
MVVLVIRLGSFLLKLFGVVLLEVALRHVSVCVFLLASLEPFLLPLLLVLVVPLLLCCSDLHRRRRGRRRDRHLALHRRVALLPVADSGPRGPEVVHARAVRGLRRRPGYLGDLGLPLGPLHLQLLAKLVVAPFSLFLSLLQLAYLVAELLLLVLQLLPPRLPLVRAPGHIVLLLLKLYLLLLHGLLPLLQLVHLALERVPRLLHRLLALLQLAHLLPEFLLLKLQALLALV